MVTDLQTHEDMYINGQSPSRLHVCIYVHIHICIYVYMCIYIYMLYGYIYNYCMVWVFPVDEQIGEAGKHQLRQLEVLHQRVVVVRSFWGGSLEFGSSDEPI